MGGLESSLLQEERGTPIQHPSSTTSRSRSDANLSGTPNVSGGAWAAARYAPMHEARRGRERKAKDRGSPEDLGIFGSSTNFSGRSQSSQQLTAPKHYGAAFDHSIPDNEAKVRPSSRPSSSVMGSFAKGSSTWASHVDPGSGALEVSGLGLGDTQPPWPSSPAGSTAGNLPPTRRGSKHDVPVAVEEAEADDTYNYAFRRESTPPQMTITRSSQPKNQRGDARRGRDDRTRERGKNMPFSTGLDPDFLSLFAS